MTARLLVNSRTKNKLYKKWLKSQSRHDKLKYKSYKKLFKRLIIAAGTFYCKDHFDTRTNTTKQLWSNLNSMFSLKRKKSELSIPSLKIENKVVTNTADICNRLISYFCTVGDKLIQSLDKVGPNDFTQYCSSPNPQSMFCNPVDANKVEKNLGF